MDHIEALILATAKLRRAHSQIIELHSDIRSFLDSSGYETYSQVNAKGTEEVWKYRLNAQIPTEFAVRCGEILHNMRTPLDHLACAIALRHSGSHKGTYFPFGVDQKVFEREVTRKTKLLPADAVDAIRSRHPYKGGNDLLWHLHDLNRADKHIPLLNTGMGKEWRTHTMGVENGGMILIIGSRHGQRLVVNNYVPEIGDPARADDGMEFLTTTPGSKFHADMEPTFHITFRNAEAISKRTAAASLSHMHELVSNIVTDFEKRFVF